MKNSNISNFFCCLLSITLIGLICSEFYIQGSFNKIEKTSVSQSKTLNNKIIHKEYTYSEIFSSVQSNKNIQLIKIDYDMLSKGVIKMNLTYNGNENDFCTELKNIEKLDFFEKLDEIKVNATGNSNISVQMDAELKKYK